jgi:hypothetical protein
MAVSLSFQFRVPKAPLFDGGAQQLVDEELQAAVNAGVLILKGDIQPLVPVGATSILRAGLQTSVTGETAGITGRVFDAAAYAVPVELGSKPHWPPRAPLELWVRRKLQVAEAQVRSVAFLIARKISRKGTPAVGFFERGFLAARPRVMSRFSQAHRRIAARLAGKA